MNGLFPLSLVLLLTCVLAAQQSLLPETRPQNNIAVPKGGPVNREKSVEVILLTINFFSRYKMSKTSYSLG